MSRWEKEIYQNYRTRSSITSLISSKYKDSLKNAITRCEQEIDDSEEKKISDGYRRGNAKTQVSETLIGSEETFLRYRFTDMYNIRVH